MIEALVQKLIDAGCSPVAAAVAVAEAFAAGVASGARKPASDAAAERRREYDRNRQRLNRAMRMPDSDWYLLVGKISERDGHRCQYCGSPDELTADHVVPLSRGGTDDEQNLVCCCVPCNRKKSNKLLHEWLPNPPMSTGHSYLSDTAKGIISREISADVVRQPPTLKTALTLSPSPQKQIVEKEKKVRARKSACPPDWQPNGNHFAKADELRIPRAAVMAKAEDMRLWAKSSGATKADWDATFHGFLRRDADKLRGQNEKPGNVIAAADRLLERVRAFDERPGGIRDGTGQNPVRLLSEG